MVKTRGGSSTKIGRRTKRRREQTHSPAREPTPPPPPPRTEAQEQQRKSRRKRNVVYGPEKRQKKSQETESAIPIDQDRCPSPQEHIPPPRRTEAGSSSDPHDFWEDTEALPPAKLFFKHTEYGKSCKMSSKCEDYKTMNVINALEGGQEIDWFRNHPQFQHVWHMGRDKNHKLMDMWMLLLRTVVMEKGKACWFVVNGVPVRYSLKEHALLSGLNCQIYPPNHENLGSLRFVKRQFGRTENISVGEVIERLKKMIGDVDRLKMAVLLFLSTVIKGSARYGFIEPFLLRIVDNLEACKTFPWGRYTFEDSMTQIFNLMDNFKGCAKPTWCFPGFIIPLEVNLIF